MKVEIPEDTDSSSISSSPEYFYSVSEYQEIYSDSSPKAQTKVSNSDHPSQGAPPRPPLSARGYLKAIDSKMDQAPPTSFTEDMISSNLTPENIRLISNLIQTLKKTPLETQNYLKDLMEGRNLPQKGPIENEPSKRNGEVMKMDARFEKWDSSSLSWTPHYYFLKA